MKPTKKTIEELLQTSEQVSLNTSEHAEIKASLLSYAQYHSHTESAAPVTQNSSWWFKVGVSSVAMFTLLIGTGAASTQSLPGDSLYVVKVDVVEELVALSKFSPQASMTYTHERFERRLAEVIELADISALTKDSMLDVEVQLRELSSEMSELIAAVQAKGPMQTSDSLELIGDALAMSDAMVSIFENSDFSEEITEIDTVTDTLNSVQARTVDSLLTMGTTTVEAHIATQILEIEKELTEGDVSATATDTVAEFVADTEVAIEQGDYYQAVQLVHEAVQLLESNDYETEFVEEVRE